MIQMYGYPYNLQSGVIWQSNPNVIISSIPYIYEDTYEKNGTTVTDRVEGFRAGDERIETGNFMLSLYETGLYGNMELEKAQGEGACICFHLASPELGELVPGKYVFGTDKKPYTFIGYCSSDYNTQNKENIPATLSEGEVIIIVSYFNVKRLLAEILRESIMGRFSSIECHRLALPNITMSLCRG